MSDSPSTFDLIPYTQITIKLQGNRNTSRQAIVAHLTEVAQRLLQGDDAGVLESEGGCGYVFATEVTLMGPSIFASEVERVQVGSLRAAVAQDLGQSALSRLDEMLPEHRAALERYYGFAARESKNLQFLNGALEQEVLAHAFRLLTRRSKAEQNAVLRAIGLGDDDVT